jgi:hypothetical protein
VTGFSYDRGGGGFGSAGCSGKKAMPCKKYSSDVSDNESPSVKLNMTLDRINLCREVIVPGVMSDGKEFVTSQDDTIAHRNVCFMVIDT